MTTLLSDDFGEADGTAINGKALDVGGTWSAELASTAQVQSHKYAEQSSGGAAYGNLADAGTGDGEVSADFSFPASGNIDAGITFRYGGTTSQFFAIFEAEPSRLVLYKYNGSVSELGSYTTDLHGTTANIKVRCSGSSIKVYIDSVERISVSDSFNSTETFFGIRNYRSGGGSPFQQVPVANFLMTSSAVTVISPWWYYSSPTIGQGGGF